MAEVWPEAQQTARTKVEVVHPEGADEGWGAAGIGDEHIEQWGPKEKTFKRALVGKLQCSRKIRENRRADRFAACRAVSRREGLGADRANGCRVAIAMDDPQGRCGGKSDGCGGR